MREGEKLHFSPKYTFREITFNDKAKLIDAFKDRIYGFYIDPAKILDDRKLGFACGLLCAATIDALASLSCTSREPNRIINWLRDNIEDFAHNDLALRFYEDFRCGLVHEGRVKNIGEFSYETRKVVERKDEIVIINPGLLLKKVEECFEKYLSDLRNRDDLYRMFVNSLKEDFGEETSRECPQTRK